MYCENCGAKLSPGASFCEECGAKREVQPSTKEWVCQECGETGNTGKFCSNCGHKR